MAVTIDSTVGGASANAYAPVSYIDTRAEEMAGAATWAAKTAGEKDVYAVRATRALDTLAFAGYPVGPTQALQWPRYDVPKPDGSTWASDAIPEPLKRAWAHLAVYLSTLTTDPFGVSTKANIRVETIDVLSTEYFAPPSPIGWDYLNTVISPMLRPWGLLASGAGSLRLVR